MKKFWKIFAISLSSLTGIALIAVIVALWLVFTPARLTPIVAGQLPRFVTCEAAVERVEITFFSSFPRLGLRVDGVSLVNPVEGAPCDTLASVSRLNATVDVRALLRRGELIVSGIELRRGRLCLYADSLGRTNYDIVRSEPYADTTSTGFTISRIDVDRVTLAGLDVIYADRASQIEARIAGLSGTLGAAMNEVRPGAGASGASGVAVDGASGAVSAGVAGGVAGIAGAIGAVGASGTVVAAGTAGASGAAVTSAGSVVTSAGSATTSVAGSAASEAAPSRDISARIILEPFDLDFSMGAADSLLTATVRGLSLEATASLSGDDADAGLTLGTGGVTLSYGGAEYLSDGAISLTASAGADVRAGLATIRGATLRLGDLEITLDGTVRSIAPDSTRIDSTHGFETDLHYKFEQWPAEKILALVPPAFSSSLEGIELSGLLSSEGTVRGIYGEGSMPMIDAGVVFSGGTVAWPALLPWPLTGASADLALHTDLSDGASHVRINTVAAATPHSVVRARGAVDRLFSDPHAVLTAEVNADLADAAPFLPESLPLQASGKVTGSVKADVRLSHVAEMALDGMRLSGSLLVSALDATYDTIKVNTPSARLDFSLPNAGTSTAGAGFASIGLAAGRLDAWMGTGTTIALDGAKLALETSDVRDIATDGVVACDFAFAAVAASMDDMSAKVVSPTGSVSMRPGPAASATRRFDVVLHSGAAEGKAGEVGAVADGIDIDAGITYDGTKGDIWQQLSPRGSISARGITADVPSLGYPVELPALALDFTPQRLRIGQARVRLDESDFSLDGTVDNIAAYFRGEDLLHADFNFNSPVTNISQLLALTSGLGDESLEAEKAADTAPDQFTGPYMVPRGIDLTLHADMKQVLWEGKPLLSNIRGDIRVRDGEMFISPELSFDSPATRGKLELMYRTPDKNNLYAAVSSFHLERIEMRELVRMIPDLDNMMPMLGGFNGEGEFHFAAEAYMDSTYRLKMSTLRGAGSIGAVNLTLRDEELFRKIAALLKYREEGVIRVDSLRAEFTVFRDEIDIYPFLLKVDRYGAVISGRHNLDMNFDYNVSLVESPLPFRAAVDVKGNLDDLRFKVFSKSRYPDFYRPGYNGIVENRQMELRNIIRDSLLERRKDEEE